MISFNQAFEYSQQIASGIKPEADSVVISLASGHILLEQVKAPFPIPAFSKSAMDGFAVLESEKSEKLGIAGTIIAGDEHNLVIPPGKCYRIMTGAKIPENAGRVIMKEHVKEENGHIFIQKFSSKTNIILKGEDAKTGTILLEAGVQLKDRHIGILATAGYDKVKVSKKPRVAILNTGTELVEAGEQSFAGSVYNSNGPQTIAQLKSMGITADYLGIAVDHKAFTKQQIQKGIEKNQVLIITGGVSEGDYDFVPEIIQELGFKIVFNKIATQPGKPTTLAVKDGKVIWGLPGNPVSSFVIFRQFVEPFIISMMGGNWQNPEFMMPVGVDITRKNAERDKWIPANIQNDRIIPVEYHGSAHIHSISFAGYMMCIPREVNKLKKGESVRVRPL